MDFPSKYVAVDTETTGLDQYRGARPFAISMVWPDMASEFCRWSIGSSWSSAFQKIVEVLGDPTVDKIFHNAKFDLGMLEAMGIQVRGQVWDTMIIGYILDGRKARIKGTLSLDGMSRTFLPPDMRKVTSEVDNALIAAGYEKDKRGKWKGEVNFQVVPLDILEKRCVGDSKLTMGLFHKLWKTGMSLFPWLMKNEHELIRVLLRMEQRGCLIDFGECERQRDAYLAVVDDVTDWFNSLLGFETGFDLNKRTHQMDVLARANLLDALRDDETGKITLDELLLRQIHHPVAHMLRAGKMAQKLSSTFLEGIAKRCVGNVVHCDYRQTSTVTGRLACGNPNLQNIPFEGGTRAAMTAEESDELYNMTNFRYNAHIKAIFKCRQGYGHIHMDKSQAEMRVLAHYARDKTMLDIFARGEKIHDGICTALYGPGWTKALRVRTKTVVFGYQYGAGLKTMASRIGGSIAVAKETKERLAKILTGLPQLQRELKAALRTNGFIQSIHGRRHYIEPRFEYRAVNYLCQGTLGDEIRSRMVEVDRTIREGGWDARLLMSIHDDLGIEIRLDQVNDLMPKLFKVMEEMSQPYLLPMPSSCDFTTTSWAGLKEIDPKTWRYSPADAGKEK